MARDDVFRKLEKDVEALADKRRAYIISYWHHNFERLKKQCESPIEQLLGGYLLNVDLNYADLSMDFRHPWSDVLYGSEACIAGCQVPVGKYRADFFFSVHSGGSKRLLIVECDGHDFHERTKEQARRDKQRDRWFLANSMEVMRFTGSEIWADAKKCAAEVGEQIEKLYSDMLEERYAAMTGNTSING